MTPITREQLILLLRSIKIDNPKPYPLWTLVPEVIKLEQAILFFKIDLAEEIWF